MRPDHLLGPEMRMSWNSGRPIIGRFASAGLGFLSSTIGCPVAGSTGSRNHTTTPQIASPHLLTRTLASPAWVSQTPIGLPAVCAAAGAQSNAVKNEIVKPSLATMENLLGKAACIAKKRIRAISVDHLPQRVRRTDAAVERPNTSIAAPTSANSVQAGASEDASHQPPSATISSLPVEASTGPPTFAAPCEEK